MCWGGIKHNIENGQITEFIVIMIAHFPRMEQDGGFVQIHLVPTSLKATFLMPTGLAGLLHVQVNRSGNMKILPMECIWGFQTVAKAQTCKRWHTSWDTLDLGNHLRRLLSQ